MTRFVLITTTINTPFVLKQWANAGMMNNDVIIVAGDHKSPHESIRQCLNEVYDETGVPSVYLTPAMQDYWHSSAVIGWNCIQRRNIALLEAITRKPQFIITIDDDNAPISESFFELIEREFDHTRRNLISSTTGWCNVGDRCTPPVTHRGFPISQRHVCDSTHMSSRTTEAPLGVFASLWSGAPDIDAVERIANDPFVKRVKPGTATLDRGTWCPFNSQATVYAGELAPLMYMWPGVGRYDDIWASYLARRVMDHLGRFIAYGHPIVRQHRNEHDLVRDLEQEMFGMRHNEKIIDVLRNVEFGDSTDLIDNLKTCFHALATSGILPLQTVIGFERWIEDLEEVLA